MTPKCPNCGSIIYSRRNVLCGVCGKRLPQELLFTPEERGVVERELDEASQREQEAHSQLMELNAKSDDTVSRYITGPTKRWSNYSAFRWLINRFKG